MRNVLGLLILLMGAALIAEGGVRLHRIASDNEAVAALQAGRDVAIAPDAPPFMQFARARRLMARGDLDGAQAIADRLATEAPAHQRAELLYALGNAQLRHAFDMFASVPYRVAAPMIGRARASYRQALMLDPDDWDARYNFSIAAALLRETEAAQPTAGDEMAHERAAWPDIPGAPNGMP